MHVKRGLNYERTRDQRSGAFAAPNNEHTPRSGRNTRIYRIYKASLIVSLPLRYVTKNNIRAVITQIQQNVQFRQRSGADFVQSVEMLQNDAKLLKNASKCCKIIGVRERMFPTEPNERKTK